MVKCFGCLVIEGRAGLELLVSCMRGSSMSIYQNLKFFK